MTSNLWNVVPDLWSQTPLLWNLVVKVLTGRGSIEDDLLRDPKSKTSKLDEEYVKVYVTVYNKFLNESQKEFLKLSRLYPTYKEEIAIKQTQKVVLKEYKQKTGINLESKIDIKDIKIGFKIIEKHVRNREK